MEKKCLRFSECGQLILGSQADITSIKSGMLDFYTSHIRPEGTILIGDFNSNVIFDKKNSSITHRNLVDKLSEKGLKSVYHTKQNQNQGEELEATFYLYRHADKAFHIDYCFASEDFINKLFNIEIGKYDDWKTHSDHTPLILTFS